jgi:hypothetical protein
MASAEPVLAAYTPAIILVWVAAGILALWIAWRFIKVLIESLR